MPDPWQSFMLGALFIGGSIVGCSTFSEADGPQAGADSGDAGSVVGDEPAPDAAGVEGGPADPSDPYYVFVTSETVPGNFGVDPSGRPEQLADEICGTAATRGNLPGTYTAWITVGAASAPSRLHQTSTIDYYTTGNALAFTKGTPISDASIPVNSIAFNESGVPVGPDAVVWTGTPDVEEGIGGGTCNGWISNALAFSGYVGNPTSPQSWSRAGTKGCDDGNAHLYCFRTQ